ncbi:MAG: ATP-binding protein, partial [Sphingomonadales bacterium]
NRQLDERRRFTEAVLSGVSSGVLGLNTAGVITLPNRAASALLMVPEDGLSGQPLLDIWPEAETLYKRVSEAHEPSAQSHITLTREERERNLLVRMAAEVKDGRVEGYVVTFDDITEQVAAQRMAAWADVARRIAHEIKNPLTPIQLSAERLKRKYQGEIQTDPEVFQQCTDTIIRQVGDLRTIVDEFSAFARMPTPIFDKENLIEVVRRSVFLQDVANPDVEFTLNGPDGGVTLLCDGRLITQALTNLLKNAVESLAPLQEKDPDFRARVDVKLTQDAIETIIAVSDNGLGLPEKLKDRLTEPYVTTRIKGTGLGLAIVKKIMEDHGGALVLQNRSAGGAEVTLVFNHDILEKAAVPPASAAALPSMPALVHGLKG